MGVKWVSGTCGSCRECAAASGCCSTLSLSLMRGRASKEQCMKAKMYLGLYSPVYGGR